MDFENAINKMITYIDSENFISKKYNVYNKEYLKKINELGFLTINFQYGIEKKRNHSKINSTHVEEKAYLTGFLKKDIVDKFLKHISSNPNIIAFSKIETFVKTFMYIPLLLDNNKIIKTTKYTISPRELNNIKKQYNIKDVHDISYIYCIESKFNRLANIKNGLFENIINALENINK